MPILFLSAVSNDVPATPLSCNRSVLDRICKTLLLLAPAAAAAEVVVVVVGLPLPLSDDIPPSCWGTRL